MGTEGGSIRSHDGQNKFPGFTKASDFSLRSQLLPLKMSGVRKLIPLLDRVLVQKITAPVKSSGGVLLPESAATKVNEGKVLAVGPGRRKADGELIPVSVAEGDNVLLPEYGGQPVKMAGEEYHIYRDEELLGILKD